MKRLVDLLHPWCVKQGRAQKVLFDLTFPRWLWHGPEFWRAVNWWWLGWYGALFMPGPEDLEAEVESAPQGAA